MPGHAATQPVIAFDTAELAFSRSTTIPASGWQQRPVPAVSVAREARRLGIDPPTVWARFRFERNALPPGPLAVSAVAMRERFIVYLNGNDVFRSDGDADTGEFGWHWPVYFPLPAALLRPGANELVIRIETAPQRPLGLGQVSVGSEQVVRSEYNRRFYFDVAAPQIINGILLTLTIGVLLCWVVRPRETIFGWLALVGTVWWFRNLQYYVTDVPIDLDLFWNLTTDSLFVMLTVVYGFAATFLDIPHRSRMIAAIATGCVVAGLLRHLLVANGHSDTPSFLMTIPVMLATLYVLGRASWRAPTAENILMFVAVTLATACGYHDLGAAKRVWLGAEFYLQPFGSLLVFSAFGFALGRRMLDALAVVEDVNANLQKGIAQATHSLELSEAARRKLEVAAAIEAERERLMRDIHDGIGSSLITALAVAERQHAPPSTIATLKRSISDLRIAVDSLEPIDGDVVMLLASLRYRMERELRDAGLAFVWKVSAVAPTLPWLDAPGALHVLRILQEAIGNILIHADAQLIEVRCSATARGDRDGVLIVIADDGRGFDLGEQARGRGLANMRARAEALGAEFTTASVIGEGSSMSIWLPLAQMRLPLQQTA